MRGHGEGTGAEVPPITLTTAPWEEVTRPPAMMVNQAIVGGIAIGMFDFANGDIKERARARRLGSRPRRSGLPASGDLRSARRNYDARSRLPRSRFRYLTNERITDPYSDLVDKIQVGESLDEAN